MQSRSTCIQNLSEAWGNVDTRAVKHWLAPSCLGSAEELLYVFEALESSYMPRKCSSICQELCSRRVVFAWNTSA